MKIIGRTNNGYILDASKDEVANLIGYYGSYSLDKNIDLNVGNEINIAQMYKQLYDLHHRHEEIDRAKVKLAECIKNMEDVLPVIDVNIDNK